MKNKKMLYLILSTVIVVMLLYITDQVMSLSYNTKIIVKLMLFVSFPLVYTLMIKESVVKTSWINYRNKEKKSMLSIVLGVLVFAIIIVAYIIMKPYIDTEVMVKEFQDKYKINESNVIYYSIYLVFVNSFLEEYFFRGFVFLHMKKLGFRKFAYFFSACAFAVYHIANFQNWMFIYAFILALIGLIVGGYIFNYLDDEQETFINSWFVHICADLAIALIGMNIFGLITF